MKRLAKDKRSSLFGPFVGDEEKKFYTDGTSSSALSGVDDQKLDDILGDGITNQPIQENLVSLI